MPSSRRPWPARRSAFDPSALKALAEAEELTRLALDEADHDLAHEIARDALAALNQPDTRRHNGVPSTKSTLITITAGAGGDEAHDWTRMLAEMYAGWASLQNTQALTLDTAYGENAGYRHITLEIPLPNADQLLTGENGVHRLVRKSPFDPAGRRHTAFASVQAYPTPADAEIKNIPDRELKISTFGSSGPGGQHMQKASTAARILHIPTGITATCQSERSQLQNITNARKILQARVNQRLKELQELEEAKTKGEKPLPSWGNRTRSYYLHPKEMVNDHRTGTKTTKARQVLDGHLQLLRQ